MQSLIITASILLVAVTPDSEESFLKNTLIACDKASSQYLLDEAESAYCSEIYEKLKNQYFSGDSAALLSWWRAEKALNKSQ